MFGDGTNDANYDSVYQVDFVQFCDLAPVRVENLSVTSIMKSGNLFRMAIENGKQNWNYSLQYSAALGAGPWTTVATVGPLATGGPFLISDVSSTGIKGFYRVVGTGPP